MFQKLLSLLLFTSFFFFILIGISLTAFSLYSLEGKLLLINLLSSLMCFAISGAIYLLRRKLNE